MEVMSQIVSIHEERNPLPTGAGDAPMIKGVKVLGVESKNGRKYPVEVMRKALEKYDGAMVNIDHPKGDEPRSYEDRFGRLVNPRLESDGIYADLSYNPKHPLAEGFAWWAANDPSAVGLSHNAQARTKLNREGVEEIEEIVEVTSVDLVAEPATTAGLMECVMRAKESKQNDIKEGRPENDENYKRDLMNNIITPYFMKQTKDNFTKMMDGFNKYLKNKDIGPEAKAKIEKAKKSILDRKDTGGFVNAINIINGIDTYGYKEAMKEEDKVIPKPKVRVEADGVDAKIAQLKAASKGLPTRGGHNIDAARKAAASMLKDPDLIPKVANAGINFFSDVAKSLSKLGDKSPFHPSYKEAAPNKKQSIADKKAAIARAYAKQGVVTMPGIDKNEYPPIPGMEGPFQYRNGKILYYDPREGKYYDRKTDMYVFEEKDMEPELFPAEKENDEGNGYEDSLKDQIGDIIMDDELHAEEKVAKLLALITGGQEEPEEAPVAEAEGDAEDEEPKEEQDEEEDKPKNTEESLRRKPSPAVARLLEEVDAYRARDRREKAVTEARKFCSDASLPTYAITESFLGILADVDKKQWKTLVEDRRRVIFRGEKPISSVPADGKLTVDSLVKALRS